MDTLTTDEQPLWFQDLVRRLWGDTPTWSQIVSTRRAVALLGRRNMVWRLPSAWETYADQVARHRVKVGLPTHARPAVRAPLPPSLIVRLIRETLDSPPIPRSPALLSPTEQRLARMIGPEWHPYSGFTTIVFARITPVLGRPPSRFGRERKVFARVVKQMEHEEAIKILYREGVRVFIRRIRPR